MLMLWRAVIIGGWITGAVVLDEHDQQDGVAVVPHWPYWLASSAFSAAGTCWLRSRARSSSNAQQQARVTS